MGNFSNFPNLVSGGDINPYRFVTVSGADNTGDQASANTDIIIGIADLSTKAFDSALHAAAGDPISLQPGFVMQVECGGTIAVGAQVQSDADGKAVTATLTTGTFQQGMVALQAGVTGTIIRVCHALSAKIEIA